VNLVSNIHALKSAHFSAFNRDLAHLTQVPLSEAPVTMAWSHIARLFGDVFVACSQKFDHRQGDVGKLLRIGCCRFI